MKTAAEQVKIITKALSSNVENPAREAKMIMSHVLGCKIAEVSIYKSDITEDELLQIQKIVTQRISGKPLQYILGTASFMDYDFIVGPGILIPRPETEILVEKTAEWISNHRQECCSPVSVIDMCTGCGNIAVSLADTIKDVNILAADISEHSKIYSHKNINKYHLSGKINFIQSDIGKQIQKQYADTMGKWNVLVSNPPYVPDAVFKNMPSEVVDHEPRKALISGNDGLYHFKQILKFGTIALRVGGLLSVELHEDSLDSASKLADKFRFFNIKTISDLAGKPRFLMCEFGG